MRSQPSKGSTFSITVDNAQGSDAIARHNEPAEPDLTAIKRLVVVIDDEQAIREGLEQLLKMWDCEVIACADETDAVRKLDSVEQTPDAIICDYRLRNNRNGFDAITTVNRACEAKIPAVIVTGDTQRDFLAETRESGHQVLHKPVAPAKLRAFLRSLPART